MTRKGFTRNRTEKEQADTNVANHIQAVWKAVQNNKAEAEHSREKEKQSIYVRNWKHEVL